MNDNLPTKEVRNPSKIINDFLTNQSSLKNIEQIKRNEEQTREEADKILIEVLNENLSDLKNTLTLSCLRKNSSLYKRYAESIKEFPEYQKYLQFYNFKGKNFLIIPLYDKNEKSLIIKTIEAPKENGETTIGKGNAFDSRDSKIHPYTKDSNVLQIMIQDDSQQYGYSTISMNKRTGEISDRDPASYKQNEKGIEGLIDTIEKKANLKLENCSAGLQSNLKTILSEEDELKQRSRSFEQQKHEIIQNIRTGNISGAINSVINIAKSFFNIKEQGRVIDIGQGITYNGDDKDLKYLEASINTVLDGEQRSKLTYLLSKIKDKQAKEGLKNKGVENPSQFDLLLQQLQPGQIMLTNALDSDGQSSSFKYATQTISGGRWCHALIISDIIKDNNGTITDAKIIHSTLKGGVHETTLKEYIESNYSSADLLLANIPQGKTDDFIKNAKSKIGEKYDRISIVTDTILGYDVDNLTQQEGTLKTQKENLMGKNKAYCSELVFDAMNSSGIELPEPHMSPSDLLLTDNITPQYACYCNHF